MKPGRQKDRSAQPEALVPAGAERVALRSGAERLGAEVHQHPGVAAVTHPRVSGPPGYWSEHDY